MSKKSRFRWPFHKQHGKRVQTHLQSGRQHLYHIYWSFWTQLSWKKFLLVLCKILTLFVNTLIANDKYSLLNRDNFSQPIQILVSQREKTFSILFSTFLKSSFKFERLEKKDDPHKRRISEITNSPKMIR